VKFPFDEGGSGERPRGKKEAVHCILLEISIRLKSGQSGGVGAKKRSKMSREGRKKVVDHWTIAIERGILGERGETQKGARLGGRPEISFAGQLIWNGSRKKGRG